MTSSLAPSRHAAPPPSRRSSAFTLVELLVVIGMIAILIGILLPVLNRARRQANNAVCMSNLRQIGVGWTNYLVESRGRFPHRLANFQWFYGGKEPSIMSASMPNWVYRERLLNPYVGAKRRDQQRADVFRCPSEDIIGNRETNETPTEWHTPYDYYGNSYNMNHNLLEYWTGAPPRSRPVVLKMVQIPHSQVLLAGDVQWYYTANETAWTGDFHRQAPYCNLVFLDGHAARIPIARDRKTIRTQDYSITIRYDQDPKEEDAATSP